MSADLAADVAEVGITARSALITGGRVLLILVIALILRFVLHRAIRRLTGRTVSGKVPVILRPIRKHATKALEEVAGLAAERRRQRAETIGSVLRSVVSIALFSIAVMLMLGELGIQLAPIIASAGIAGVALGFGAQNVVKDFLNGIFMILEDQYGVGDVVDLGEAIGTIEAVGLRTTRLRDGEGVVWYVRNGEVIRVGNRSQGSASVMIDMPVAHGTDLDEAQEILARTLAEFAAEESWKDLVVEPPKVLGVESVTPTGITVRVLVTTVPPERFSVAREVRRRLTTALDEAGIRSPSAPFPIPGEPLPGPPGAP